MEGSAVSSEYVTIPKYTNAGNSIMPVTFYDNTVSFNKHSASFLLSGKCKTKAKHK
jgi:hypothetical protein